MRERFCKVCRGWHDPEAWPHNCLPERPRRSHLPAPHVVMDSMDPVTSMLDGKLYDSKAALRATYKEAGVTEVGNDSSITDPKPRATPRPKREEVRASVSKALSQTGLSV